MRLTLPLVLHIREAEDDGLALLEEVGLPGDWPVHRHCFTEDWSAASVWLKRFPGSKLGVTAAVTDPRSARVHDWVRQVALENILLETDAPYFLPYGERREVALPGDVAHVAAQVAVLKGATMEEVLEKNLASVHQVYGVKPVLDDEGISRLNKQDFTIEVVKAKFQTVF